MGMLKIKTKPDYQRILDRIEELAGCLEDTPEERELIALVAIEICNCAHECT